MTVGSFLFAIWLMSPLATPMIAMLAAEKDQQSKAGCIWFIAGVLFGPLALLAVLIFAGVKAMQPE